MSSRYRSLFLISGVLWGCGGDGAAPVADGGGVPEVVTQTVGAAGGTVTATGVTLAVPAGALASDQSITVTRTLEPAPAGLTTYSPVYRFEPDGLTFAQPVAVTMQLTTPGTAPGLFWSQPAGGYERIEGTLAGDRLSAEVTHFSRGLVGVQRGAPTITTFLPYIGIVAGDEVTVTGTYFEAPVSVRIGPVAAQSVTRVSDTELRFVAGAETTRGKLVVTTATGSVQSAKDWTPLPLVTDLTPTSGAVGTQVVITGKSLLSAMEVVFVGGPGVVRANLVEGAPRTNQSLTVTVPTGAQSGFVIARDAAFNGVSAKVFTVLGVPTITSFTPDIGNVTLTEVTVLGTNFIAPVNVSVGDIPALSVTRISDTEVRFVAGAASTVGNVVVTTPNGRAESATTWFPRPGIVSYAPTVGAIGAQVVLTGRSLHSVASVRFFGDVVATIATTPPRTNYEMTVTVPAGAVTGPIELRHPRGSVATLTDFTVLQPPTITSFTPDIGNVTLTEVTVLGTGFVAPVNVSIGDIPALSVTRISDTEVRFVAGAGSTVGHVVVTTPGGRAESATTWFPRPGIVSYAPTVGAIGAQVVLTGRSLHSVASVRFFGDVVATIATTPPRTNYEMTVTVPAGAVTGPIELRHPRGSVATLTDFTVLQPPTITSFTPDIGNVTLTEVTVLGTNFIAPVNVSIGDIPALSVTRISDMEVRFVAGAGSTVGHVVVTTPGGRAESATTWFPRPGIVSFAPTTGAVGAQVVITGRSLHSATSVRFFGDVVATIATTPPRTNYEMTVTVPAGAVTGPIELRHPRGSVATLTDFTIIPTPTITSFTPDIGNVTLTEITVLGTGFVAPVNVSVGDIPALSVTRISDTEVRFVAGAASTVGHVAVTTPGGRAESATTWFPRPGIVSYAPTAGAVGMQVVITGRSLHSATSVRFFGDVVATIATTPPRTNYEMTVTVPAGAVTGPIELRHPRGSVATLTDFTIVPVPTITSFTPDIGNVTLTEVTVLGTGFVAPVNVSVGDIPAMSVTRISDTEVRFIPGTETAVGKVVVTTPGGTAQSATSWSPRPALLSYAPTSGAVGAQVVLTGRSLLSATSVRFFPGAVATIAASPARTNQTMTVTVPAGAATGPLEVLHPRGSVATQTHFTVLQPPTLTSFSPATGLAGSSAYTGTVITLTGNHFQEGMTVKFNGVLAYQRWVDSPTQVRAIPALTTTSGPLTIETANGRAESTGVFQPVPRVLSMTPATGLAGTQVVLTGHSLDAVQIVLFPENRSSAFTMQNGTQLTTTVPPGAITGAVSVVGPGQGISPAGTFTVPVPPTLSGFTPPYGPVGTALTLSGTDLAQAQSVTLGGISCAFTAVDATTLSVTVPFAASTGVLRVVTPGGAVQSATSFVIFARATSLTPASGEAGTLVTAVGDHFTGIGAVRIGNAVAPHTLVSDTELRFIVPGGAASGKVRFQQSDSLLVDSGQTFTVLPTPGPSITSVSVASGATGTELLLTGTRFTGATAVYFAGHAPSANFVVDSATQLRTVVPLSAMTGTIRVVTPFGEGASPAPFTVTNALTITDFTPRSSPAYSGLQLTVTGTGFTGVDNVKLNGVTTGFTVVSATELRVSVQSDATTGLLYVQRGGASRTSTVPFTVTTTPYITSLTPPSAGVGDCVFVYGVNLRIGTEANVRSVGGVPDTSNTSQTATAATVCIPRGAASGPISITTSQGTVTAPLTLTGPVITGFTPNQAPTTAEVQIFGVRLNEATEVIIGGGVAAFTLVSGTLIRATVPPFAYGNEPLNVRRADGSLIGSRDNFRITDAPSVASFTPAGGAVGTNVVLSGYSFGGATAVRFGGVDATSFTVNAVTAISATVPAGAATGPITVVKGAQSGSSTTPFYVRPALDSATPGIAIVGQSVALAGTSLNGVTEVRVNGTLATLVTSPPPTSTALSFVVPVGATTGPITVTTPADTVTSGFSLIVNPSLTSFSPASGAVGSTLTLTGHGFGLVTGVEFPSQTAASFTLRNANTLDVVVPAGAQSGKVRVLYSGGFAETTTDFHVAYVPALLSFTVAQAAEGQTVGLVGQNLTGATQVELGGIVASFSVANPERIDAVVPIGASTALWRVTTPDGVAVSPTTFRVLKLPTLTSFTPTSGPVGTTVTLTGTNLDTTTAVSLPGATGDVPLGFTVSSATSLLVTLVPGATSGVFKLTNADGVTQSATAFTVVPVLTAVSPAQTGILTEIQIQGTSLFGTLAVTLGGLPLSYSTMSDTLIRATIPSGAVSGLLTLTRAGGATVSTASPYVILPPSISSFTPAQAEAGDVVLVSGAGFVDVTAVRLGELPVNFGLDSNFGLRFVVPPGASSGPITLSAPQGSAASSGSLLVSGPQLFGFTPASGAPGAEVTLAGVGLETTTAVLFNGAPATFTVTSATSLTAVVPTGATTGPITLVTPAATLISPTAFTVTGAPEVLSFSPTVGAPGTEVVVSGRHFTGATAVAFGALSAAFTVLGDGQLRTTVPAGATTATVHVTTPTGTATSGTAFTVQTRPEILSFGPPDGPIGTRVTLLGVNLSGLTSVKMAGISAVFSILSDRIVNVIVPPGAPTSFIDVAAGEQTARTATRFEVWPSACVVSDPGFCPGSILLLEASNRALLEIDPLTGATATVTSKTTAGALLTSPMDLALDWDGNVVIADSGSFDVRVYDGKVVRVDAMTGAQSLVTSGGQLNEPFGITLDADGALLVVDHKANALRGAIVRVDPATGAQTLAATLGLLLSPRDAVLMPSGALAVVDQGRGVLTVDLVTGAQTQVSTPFYIPTSLAYETDTTVLITDTGSARLNVTRVDLVTGQETVVATGGHLTFPRGVAVLRDGALIVSDSSGKLVRVEPSTGGQTVLTTVTGTPRQLIVVP